MTFISYAQNFEDVILWRALQDVEKGRYVDIGAQDPVIDSVSFAFYQAGWRGVHVEPVPEYASKLREARPDEMVIQAAVSNSVGPIPLYELGGLSTGSIEIAERHKQCGQHPREIMVTTVALDRLLGTVGGEIHWLKIDVEGMEADVLRSWRRNSARPWVAVIESTIPNSEEPTQGQWIDEILSRGYEEVLFDGLNRYFLHESHPELRDRLNRPANVFDQFSLTSQHFSAAELRADLDETHRRLTEGQAEAEALQAAASEATNACEIANAELKVVSERLMTVEQNHRAAVESLLQEHERTEEQLRSEARENEGRLRREWRENEEQLRKGLRNAEGAAAAARIEAARFEERSAQLQEKLDRTDGLLGQAEVRLVSFNEQLVAARARAMQLENERAQARVELENTRTATDDLGNRLDQEIGRLRAALIQADSLMKRAVQEPVGIWQKFGQGLGLAGARPGWRALVQSVRAGGVSRHEPWATGSEREVTEQVMNSSAPVEARNPYFRANSLAELLSWNDADFVRCAYVTILGRQPDRGGETHYVERIRRGYSKMEILWQLRCSAEARSHDPGIAGLDRALRRTRARSWLSRSMRRLRGAPRSTAPDSSPRTVDPTASTSASWQSLLPQTNAKRIDVLVREKEMLVTELEALKGIVDGLGHAVVGMANAQKRQELQLRDMGSTSRRKVVVSSKK